MTELAEGIAANKAYAEGKVGELAGAIERNLAYTQEQVNGLTTAIADAIDRNIAYTDSKVSDIAKDIAALNGGAAVAINKINALENKTAHITVTDDETSIDVTEKGFEVIGAGEGSFNVYSAGESTMIYAHNGEERTFTIDAETGNLETKGTVSFANGAFIANETGVAVNGGFTVNGNAIVNGGFTVSGNANVTGGLTVGTDVVANGTSLKVTASQVAANAEDILENAEEIANVDAAYKAADKALQVGIDAVASKTAHITVTDDETSIDVTEKGFEVIGAGEGSFNVYSVGERTMIYANNGEERTFNLDIETGNMETKGSVSFAGGAFVANQTGAAVNGSFTVSGNANVTGGLIVGTDVVAGGTSLKETSDKVANLESTKADKNYVDNQIAGVNSSLANKADKDYVDAGFANVNESLAGKADKDYVDAGFADVNESLVGKADKDYVDAGFADVNESLAGKADQSYVDSKFDTVTGDIASKADKDYVDAELAGKADKDNVYTKAEADDKFLTQEEADNRYVQIGTKTETEGDETTTTTEAEVSTNFKVTETVTENTETGQTTVTTKVQVGEGFIVENVSDDEGCQSKVTINADKEAVHLVVGDGAKSDKIVFGTHSSWYTDQKGFFFGGGVDQDGNVHVDDLANAYIKEDGSLMAGNGNFKVGTTGNVEVKGSISVADGKFVVAADGSVEAKGDVKVEGKLETKELVVNGVEIGALTGANSDAINGLNQRLGRLTGKVNKVGAGAAAMAALHPLEYDPEDKLTFSAGVGNYGGQTAAALGAFYRPDEKLMISLGGTMGNDENMVNLGVSIGLDGAKGLPKLSKKEMVEKINTVEAENEELLRRIARLEKLVVEMAKKDADKK